jgi:hydroxyacylglutathione hydrolase
MAAPIGWHGATAGEETQVASIFDRKIWRGERKSFDSERSGVKRSFSALSIVFLSVMVAPCRAQKNTGSMPAHWNEGAKDCKSSGQPPIQAQSYNNTTFLLRENLCATFEGPFMYLLVGSSKALLIDSGDLADPEKMPLARTVLQLLPGDSHKLPLLVAHTHRHSDHREGDSQFAKLPDVQVVGFELEAVKQFFHFSDWPNGVAQIDLGGRIVDVLPTPGHNPTEISFYDRDTGLFFSGDFFLPGRLIVEDKGADLASAKRVADFVKDKPVTYVLGGHIELNSAGKTFRWGSNYHPDEHALQMTKDDLLKLPHAVEHFNGYCCSSDGFVMVSMNMLWMTYF